MKKTILLYGLALAGFVAIMKLIEYQYFIRELSGEVYTGIIALAFTSLGIWAGLRLTRRKTVLVDPNFSLNETELTRLGISARELEVLQSIALGLSNQEIADKLFVSANTIKTHISNLFMKLGVSRRTQAIQRAKELRLIQ